MIGAKGVGFADRHIGPSHDETRTMLETVGVASLDDLIDKTVPPSIRFNRALKLPSAASEAEALVELGAKFSKTKPVKSFIGQGYHGCIVPPVVLRNLFENPAWYTAYTPYQSEISQGRLEMLFHFQTLVCELTGLPIASASLLDEATAVAEAAGVAVRHHRSRRTHISIAGQLHPQDIEVLETRAGAIGLTINGDGINEETAALVIPYADTFGQIADYSVQIEQARQTGALVIIVADPLALTIAPPPADWGADIAVGSLQRFGVPMGFGGPHAAYMAVREDLTRLMPGRLVGQSVDTTGKPAFRLALQTREQHIRRDKATSNICTAQALLANMAAAFAIWHGPEGLQAIALHVKALAHTLQASCKSAGMDVLDGDLFDCVCLRFEDPGKVEQILNSAQAEGLLLRRHDELGLSISFDETSTRSDLEALASILGISLVQEVPQTSRRAEHFLSQDIFRSIKSETAMMRYLRTLSDKDLSLDRSMIPLGSCTMKLNAAAEMAPVSWPEVGNLHPFSPTEYAAGHLDMISDLEAWLCEITGFSAMSLQPNAGSQGEFAGLLAIRHYHQSQGQTARNKCLIPASAHGTNPASAQMAGLDVVVVKCTDNGDIDLEDLGIKIAKAGNELAALMLTYPSTHGVFEEDVVEICQMVHDGGGQVYFDGANLNAMVGLARPGDIGADVCHLNLHKTFCIPHGGGGPGIGPIGVAAHLVPFLPGKDNTGPVAAAHYGSASILPITWMYLRMMGPDGLTEATKLAILNANYLATRLHEDYPVLFRGKHGFVAHECILDTRIYKDAGIGVEDFAKRLIDYGFHAPTMSWPVAGTLMVEPTESEPKSELDRFVDAMLSIATEAKQVKSGAWPKDDNPLVNAPHAGEQVLSDNWSHPYSRSTAAFPLSNENKFWPPVSRVDNVYGDRNLVCTCPPISEYVEAAE